MAAYEVVFATSAAKEFRSLPTGSQKRIAGAIDGLAKDPRPQGVRKLAGHDLLYRIRVGSYRIVYEIHDQERFIRVTRVRHRRDAYR